MVVAGIFAFVASAPIVAHHGAAAAFDVTKTITVQGTMTEFLFVNPHVQLYFERKNDKGEVEKWQGALTAPSKLSRAGWNKRTLQPGDQVTVSGNPARNGSNSIWIRKLIGPKGDSLPLFEE
jgi:hypothetical protein